MADSQYWNGTQLAVYLIAFILAIGPFFNGMFFEPIRLVGVALPCVAYWMWYARRQHAVAPVNGLDLSVLAWLLSYIIASVNPVLPRGHLSVLLDLVAFVGVYTVMRFSPGWEQAVSRILVGFGLAMLGLSVARLTGLTWLSQSLIDLVISGRLSGGFQYPNTFAVWLFCLTLLALRDARAPRVGSLFLAVGGLFAGGFMLTLSRGALIAAPAAYLAVVGLGSREDRTFIAWAGLLTWGPSFILGSAALHAFQQHQQAVGLALLTACALPPLAAPYLAKLTGFLWNHKRTWGIAIGGAVLIAVLAATVKIAPRALPALSEVTDNRMTSGYELSDSSMFTRLIFDSWAWRIMSANHMLGAGGRAWTKLYFQAQNFPYFTTEVHNHFLQTGVEAGLIGLMAFTAILLLCVIIAWRSRRQLQGDISLAVWAGVVTYIGIHSAIDFDLSYISLLLFLAVAAGFISSRNRDGFTAVSRWIPYWHRAVAAATLVAFVTTASLYVSKNALLASDQAWGRGDIPGTIAKLNLARRTDPLNAEPWLRMAALKATERAPDVALPDMPVLLEKALSLDQYNPGVTLDLAGIALRQKEWTQAADLALKADSFMPLDQELNAAVASMLWGAASGAAQAGEVATARSLAARFKEYDSELKQRINQAAPYAKYARAPVAYTATVRLRIGQGLLLAGDYAEAVDHLRNATTSQPEKDEATQWLYAALDLEGNRSEAEKLRSTNPGLITQFLQSDLYHKVVAVAKEVP